MDQKSESASHSLISKSKRLSVAFGCLALFCGLGGCTLTVVLFLADNGNPQTGQERAIDNMLNAFSYLVPLGTAVISIALILASISLWYFFLQQEET